MTTLLELVETLARDPQAKAAYQDAPDTYLASNGFGDLSPAEVNEAVLHAADVLPPLVSAQFEPEAGLASVASADPAGFDQPHTSEYEEDLFGLDQDSPIFADGELNDAPDEQPGPHGDPQDPFPSGAEPADQHPALNDAVGADDQPADAEPATEADPELRQLVNASDPHDLDAEPGIAEAAPGEHGGALSQPSVPSLVAEQPEPEPDTAEFNDPFDGDDLSSSTTHLTDSDLTDTDLFEQVSPLSGAEAQPLVDGGDREPFDGVDQPEDDILEDVGDFDLE